jgi:hypothetical protein
VERSKRWFPERLPSPEGWRSGLARDDSGGSAKGPALAAGGRLTTLDPRPTYQFTRRQRCLGCSGENPLRQPGTRNLVQALRMSFDGSRQHRVAICPRQPLLFHLYVCYICFPAARLRLSANISLARRILEGTLDTEGCAFIDNNRWNHQDSIALWFGTDLKCLSLFCLIILPHQRWLGYPLRPNLSSMLITYSLVPPCSSIHYRHGPVARRWPFPTAVPELIVVQIIIRRSTPCAASKHSSFFFVHTCPLDCRRPSSPLSSQSSPRPRLAHCIGPH